MSSDTPKDIGSFSSDGKTIHIMSQEGHLDSTIINADTIEVY
jgi:hypothetical protein